VIAWLAPAAAIAFAAVTLPLLVHLLLRHRAERVIFPSVRFLTRSDESSWRLRAPSDWLLLAVRIGIVAAAALALMQPLWITEGRRRAWSERTVRAIIVDTSGSVDRAAARLSADGETKGALATRRIDSRDVSVTMPQAIAWLTASAPARREVVIVSDFQHGALNERALENVPRTIGVRMVPVGARRDAAVGFESGRVLHGDKVLAQRTQLVGWETGLSLSGSTSALTGLEIFADIRDPAAAAAIQAVEAAGAVAPSADQPIAIRFRGGAPVASPPEIPSPWARAAAVRLLSAPGVHDAALQVSQRGGALNVAVDAPADAWAAVEVLHATLNARRDERTWHEREPERITEPQLAAWTRGAPPPAADAWRQSDDNDGRWLWLVAIGLMAVEHVIRRASVVIRSEAARAA
jgi:hypothetical protein